MEDRTAVGHLQTWLKSRRRKPLVLRGARQVGKSTLVRRFAAHAGLRICEVNLERHLDLDEIFSKLDIAEIIAELEVVGRQSLHGSDVVLFLDEVQATPHALQALRYFYEDRPELPVIAAGSLLEFTLADHSFPMPVGRVEYHHLGPMTFEEFLVAHQPTLLEAVRSVDWKRPLPQAAHDELTSAQRTFLLTGGLPEAVLAFVETGSFVEVERVHRSVADTYRDDFSRYAARARWPLLQRLFRAIPAAIGRKVKYAALASEARSSEVKAALELLVNARICHRVLHSHANGVPLLADVDDRTFKMIFLDVGLVSHVCGFTASVLGRLDERSLVNEGPLAEQFIGQHLAYADQGRTAPELTYWLRQGKTNNAEVDYVVADGRQVLPIEVKAGKSGSLRSVHQFVARRGLERAVRFDLNPPSRHHVTHRVRIGDRFGPVEFELISLPLYLVEQMRRLAALHP